MPETKPIILGVDPGSHATGYGLITQEGTRLIHIHSGTIRPSRGSPLHLRLRQISEKLREVIRQNSPSVMALESVFVHKNVRSAILLAHVRGVALLEAAHTGLSVAEYSPMEVKKGVTGFGRASKEQVSDMVARLFRQAVAGKDASDAIAIALCHLNHAAFARKIEEWRRPEWLHSKTGRA